MTRTRIGLAARVTAWGFILTLASFSFSLESLAAQRTLAPATAEALAAQYRERGRTATDAAQAIKDQFRLDADGAAKALRAGGYLGGMVATGVRSVYALTAAGLAGAMVAAGFEGGIIAIALKREFSLTALGVAGVLVGARFNLTSIAAGLKTAGFGIADIVAALAQHFRGDPESVVNALKSAGYTSDDYGAPLIPAFGLTLKDFAALMKRTLHSVGQTVKVMVRRLSKPVDAAAALVWGYVLRTAREVAAALKEGGYQATDVAEGIKAQFSLTTPTGPRDRGRRARTGSRG